MEPKHQYTPRAQQALALARQEAIDRKRSEIGTEDLLVGLIRLGAGVAVSVLAKLGLDLATARAAVARWELPEPKSPGPSPLPYAQGVKLVLVLAAKHAQALSHSYIGTEHILLGLLGDTDGPAGRVLQSFNVDLDRARQVILEELDPRQVSVSTGERPGIASLPISPQALDALGLADEAVKRVVTLADEEARRIHHNYVGTDHLLLGLIRLDSGVAVAALRQQGVELEALRQTIELMVLPGGAEPFPGKLPYTPRTRKVLEQAGREAEKLGHSCVGPEHLLLAMIGDNEGVAYRALKSFNVDYERTRAAILEQLGPGGG